MLALTFAALALGGAPLISLFSPDFSGDLVLAIVSCLSLFWSLAGTLRRGLESPCRVLSPQSPSVRGQLLPVTPPVRSAPVIL
jgi:hypothetical protein